MRRAALLLLLAACRTPAPPPSHEAGVVDAGASLAAEPSSVPMGESEMHREMVRTTRGECGIGASGMSYGAAQGRELPRLCDAAVRFLSAAKLLCKGVANVQRGRLGLAGFSRGGLALFPALAATSKVVEELYLFDCNPTADAAGTVIQWFASTAKKPCLRMVGGAYNVDAYRAIVRAIGTVTHDPGPRPNLTLELGEPGWFDKIGNYWERHRPPTGAPARRGHAPSVRDLRRPLADPRCPVDVSGIPWRLPEAFGVQPLARYRKRVIAELLR